MRKLTVELMDCSEVPIVDGDEHSSPISVTYCGRKWQIPGD
jgi:hypothetical protein